jgi:hypothetical protein
LEIHMECMVPSEPSMLPPIQVLNLLSTDSTGAMTFNL